jgi:cell division protein FtsW (lipid II flippase)
VVVSGCWVLGCTAHATMLPRMRITPPTGSDREGSHAQSIILIVIIVIVIITEIIVIRRRRRRRRRRIIIIINTVLSIIVVVMVRLLLTLCNKIHTWQNPPPP